MHILILILQSPPTFVFRLRRRGTDNVFQRRDILGLLRARFPVCEGVHLARLPGLEREGRGGFEDGRMLPLGDEIDAVAEPLGDGVPAPVRQFAAGAVPEFAEEVDEGGELEVGIDEPGEAVGGAVAVSDVVVFDHVEREAAEEVFFRRGHAGASVRVVAGVVGDKAHPPESGAGEDFGQEVQGDLGIAVPQVFSFQTIFQLVDRGVFLGE